MYEQGEGKKYLPVSRYYRSDYIGLAMIKNFFLVTIGYCLILAGIAAYFAEYLIDNVHKMNLVSLGVEVILGYVAVLVLFSVLTYIQYTVKYHKAKKSVKNYYEERGQHKRICEIDRIVQGCTGIRRTTGQHPGGIIVLPMGHEIYQFTPVQRPANDMTTDTVTTHFDYHSIDHNLLKLDILGHDDPTMIRMLEDLTGIDAQKIPLDEPKVMSLFQNTSALGIAPEDIGGCPLGSLGIPEFGTDFVIQMLIDTKPQSFSDLIRISGLSHGTDVWLGNAQTLIEEGKATISTAILSLIHISEPTRH